MDTDRLSDPRIRVGALLAMVAYLLVSGWAVLTGDPVATFVADGVFVVAIVAFGLYVRVVQAAGDRLLRVTGSLLVASGLAQAYLMVDPGGPITPAVPNVLVIGGGILYLWAMSGREAE